MAQLTSEGRQLRDAVAAVLRDTDGLFLRLAQDVGRVIRVFRTGTLQPGDRAILRRLLDRVLGPVYGVTRAAVRSASLYRLIVANMDTTALNVFGSAVRQIEEMVTGARGADAWERLRFRIINGAPDSDPFRIMVRGVLDGPAMDRHRLLRSRSLDPQRRWVPRERWNTKTGYRLSDRLWMHGQETRRGIDRRIQLALRNGTSADALARDLEQHLLRGVRPVRDAAGRIVDLDQGPGVLTRTPWQRFGANLPGGMQRAHYINGLPDRGWGSFSARRLARTELTRVHGAATLVATESTPGALGAKWVLSASHPEVDHCDENARNSSAGLPAGVYLVSEFPQYPDHPHELCHIQRAMKSRDEVLDELETRYGAELGVVA